LPKARSPQQEASSVSSGFQYRQPGGELKTMSELIPRSGTPSRHLQANQFFPQRKQKIFKGQKSPGLKAAEPCNFCSI